MREKPDCTGQRFGRLVVLGKGSRKLDKRNSYRQLWLLKCDCGNTIERQRGDFDNGYAKGRGIVSCGCKRKLGLVDNNRRPENIAGQRFGNLIAISLTGKKNSSHKPTWLMQCDCGKTREMSLSHIRSVLKHGWQLNCADSINHPRRYNRYPLTPTPYPPAAGDLVIKYLHLTRLHYKQIDNAVEDDKRDRLIRAAWIITYRRQQGELITDLHEKRIINKHLRYSSIKIFWQRQTEKHGGLMYDRDGNKREIGSTVTNPTLNNYPVLETPGNLILPTRKLRFKRR